MNRKSIDSKHQQIKDLQHCLSPVRKEIGLGVFSKSLKSYILDAADSLPVDEAIVKRTVIEKVDDLYSQLRKIENIKTSIAAHQDATIKTTVLQWPHHHWLPDMDLTSNSKMFDEFLDRVDPSVIVFTEPPTGTRQYPDKIEEYISGYLKKRKDKRMQLIFLHESDKSIRVISLLFDSQTLEKVSPREIIKSGSEILIAARFSNSAEVQP